jgi:small subunit ribosomal protein S20
MPITKSAARRMRANERKRLHNRAIKSRLKSLNRRFRDEVKAGKKEEAAAVFRTLCSALDKAAKTGVIHRATASRKRSRLAVALNKLK